jgi:outer membrane protein OmpA-like peptidoglycan-associated protein
VSRTTFFVTLKSAIIILAGILFAAICLAEEEIGPESAVPASASRSISSLHESVNSLHENESSLNTNSADLAGRNIAIDPRIGNLDEKDNSFNSEESKLIKDEQLAEKGVTVTETDSEINIELASDVLFDFNRWSIRQSAIPALEEVAKILKSHANLAISLTGHTDSIGTEAYNNALSLKRAKSVYGWLIHFGELYDANILTSGKGKSNPIAPNTNPDGSDNPLGRQKNRRVEIRITK